MFEEYDDFRKKIREFALENFTNNDIRKYDMDETYPDELRKKAISFIDMANPIKIVLAIEELCRVDAGLGIAVTTPYFGNEIINLFGNDAQKKILLDVMSGRKILGLGVTEPTGGSDVAGLKTTAVKSGNKYIINGSKIFITNGSIADYILVLARTSNESKRHLGLSVFLVDTKSKGFSASKLHGKLGVRATDTAELKFNDLEVDESMLVGEEGMGFYYIMIFFDISRVYVAAQALGIAEGALDSMMKYVKENNIRDENTMFDIARVYTRVQAARLLTYNATMNLVNSVTKPEDTSAAKAYAGEAAVYAAEKALEITGLSGYRYNLDITFRNAKIMEIWEGTTDVENLIIARTLLKGD
ncbi:acyl-CoA dehydrogenase family protein [Picrophilus oshimae]|uniref:Acyl-CoA dehydrogenase n=1 Tax=Picrophilus torridus (strain ATCC 700027 / DSM 9790 / JCM 10055 / NBRC 100828 / KAW 2/3) TaxID=1122961 RepID=A0A8G2FXC3_PICTO|nr:acyl-CoA dehydrogenase family protein [Picrophilus oshimae]SMD31236.1 acyl-CoA dehydrogenase [Picrophilus oshimae DSM 9789]